MTTSVIVRFFYSQVAPPLVMPSLSFFNELSCCTKKIIIVVLFLVSSTPSKDHPLFYLFDISCKETTMIAVRVLQLNFKTSFKLPYTTNVTNIAISSLHILIILHWSIKQFLSFMSLKMSFNYI